MRIFGFLLLSVLLVACSAQVNSPEQAEASVTPEVSVAPTMPDSEYVSIFADVKEEDVAFTSEISASLAVEVRTLEEIVDNAQAIALLRVEKRAQVTLEPANQILPYTFVEVEILETFKGSLSEPLSFYVEGGYVPLQLYARRLPTEAQAKQGITKEILEQNPLVAMFPLEYVDLKEGKSYVAFMQRNTDNGAFYPYAFGFTLFEYDEGNDQIYSPYLEESYPLDLLRE